MGHWAAAYKTIPKESSNKAQGVVGQAGGWVFFFFKKGWGVGLEKKDGCELDDVKITNLFVTRCL